MRYLVDGYNLFFHITKNPNPFQKKRDQIVQLLDQEIVKSGLQVTAVFDSSEKRNSGITRKHLEGIEVIFTSEGLSADEYILEMIACSSTPQQLTIVTEDQELLRKSRSLGSLTMQIPEFLALMIKKQRRKSKTDLQNYEDTEAHIQRLLRIFEDRLNKP
jgi:predicted RNA-binding protein with PIN domain